ncbi:aminoglycoside phosphotransferase family protein [Methylovulum psychrotolerans]|uniref:Aminoglycoside phosphotransferase n=1 Tax=Methylovulum psychrotolerans TaxID=1704499 RepID=A0A2S5CJ44_9GAMM|nr:phosphotransferase [Methylovulum psychrotolerans]POZ50762.1 aminoglycoside phosphotransferase [Methylovulum psychrotolerans]
MSEDLRTLTLRDWLENDLLLEVTAFRPASSDASFRRYFRVTTPDAVLIAMDAPPATENLPAFIKVAGLLAATGLQVPTIFGQNLEDGFLLLEDFGSQAFLDTVAKAGPEPYYPQALTNLLSLQTHTDSRHFDLPRYDEALLKREFAIFNDWFVGQWLDIELPAAVMADLERVLISSALAQPVVCVHRDYHSRNLMVLADGTLGVLDFQDAVLGPITYDAVSLLRDCYITWPPEQVAHWLTDYHQHLQQAGQLTANLAEFTRWFDLMGLQRHLKAIGIFTRLHLRDGKSGYLNDIPRTLGYVQAVTAAYPELAAFDQLLHSQLLPAYRQAAQRITA